MCEAPARRRGGAVDGGVRSWHSLTWTAAQVAFGPPVGAPAHTLHERLPRRYLPPGPNL
jgi:hypothetical protein